MILKESETFNVSLGTFDNSISLLRLGANFSSFAPLKKKLIIIMTTSTTDQLDPLIGRSLNDFVIETKLGEGGFGAVYKATQLILGREAVIKVLHAKHRTNPEIIKRFKREAHLASRLEHPYCAHIYSFGAEDDGLLWIAMEYVQGTSLSEILKSQKNLPIERFIPLLDKICEVVHTAHEFGIVHRDLKPANIMVISRAGRMLPKLLDFGIAKGLEESAVLGNKTSSLQIVEDKNSKQNALISCALGKNETVIVDGKSGLETIISDIEDIFESNTVIAKVHNVFFNLQNAFQSKSIPDSQGQSQTVMFDAKATAVSDDQESGYVIKTQGLIGSPAYMSPEQWQAGEIIDSCSDIYSLGILTYQTITGELPFKEEGFELYGAHINKPIPKLKEGFPGALNDVMKKVLAKVPKDRYQTTLEFAKEFRQAAGFTQEEINLPKFDEILKENILANAPKPLADTVANLLAANNAYQFKDRILIVFRVLVRYIGILALASHVRIASDKQNQELINQSIAGLRQHGLTEVQWLELSRDLCLPFAKKCDAYPIPELVSLFFTLDGEALSSSSETFAKLLQLQQEIYSAASLEEARLLVLLTDFLAKLTSLLKATSWLNDYYLVLPDGDKATKWMGIAKDIGVLKIKADNFFDKKTALVDAQGYYILSLWPLIEITEPTPSTPLEVFLLDCKGRDKEKTRLVSFPHGFQIETQAPSEWIKDNFFPDEEKKQTDLLPEISPYLGLTTFSPTDSAFFFGREKETESFLNRLRIKPLLAVVGPSGAGKSSFVQAGVIPNLDEQWRIITVRPGAFPLANLSGRLIKEGIQISKLDINSKAKVDVLGNALSNFSKAKNVSILLVIDQFEELFTLCLDQQERELYAKYLVNAAKSEEEPIRIIITLRDDFLIRVKSLPSLRDQIAQNLELLATPQPEDLLRILTQPAKRFGYQFEDEELPKEIVESVKKEVSALPLLAFTAAKLWDLRDRQFRKLQRKTYVEMGGIGGSLTQHAETVMAEMSQDEQKLLREAFRHLVTSEGTRAVLTRSDLKELLGSNREADLVIEKLVTARLLVASEGESGVETIEVIHEALLSAWPRLVKWRQEVAEGARLRDQLRVAARQWQERGRPKGLLWRDEALAEYQLWKLNYKGNLTDVEKEFGLASLSEANRSQRIKQGLVIAAMIVLLLGSGVMFYQRQQTQKQLSQTLELYEEQARQEIIKNNLDGAAVYLSEAYAKGASSLALKYMLSIALARAEERPPIALTNHTGAIMMASFSSDDQMVVTASSDKTARIWNANTGKELFVLKGHEDAVLSAQFSPDTTEVLTSSLDKTAKIWRVFDGSTRITLAGHTDGLRAAMFSPDGKQILTISYDTTAKIWDVLTGKLISTLSGHKSGVYAACYSKDGKLIATASADKTAKIWDSSNGKLLKTLSGHQASVMSVAFSPDAKLLVTGSNDNRAKVWQVSDGKLIYTLAKHKEAITSSKFSSDGKNILTSSKDKTACIWETETGTLANNLSGHQKDIAIGDFSPDAKLIVTSSYDNTARIWERATGKFLVTLAAHEASLSSAVFSSNGEKVLTASLDKSVKIWTVVAESRLPKEISLIVKEKVPIYLQEGRLIAKDSKINTKQTEKQETPIPNKTDENIVTETLDNGIKIEMVKIEGGTFEMGSLLDEKGHSQNEQLHTVTVSPFYIGKYEVTQEQWREVASQPLIKTSLLAHPSTFQGDKLPVDNISWEEAVEFCARLSKLTGKTYRLPTEAEWEFAARAGSKDAFSGNLEDMGWYEKNSQEKTHIVGQKLPNTWGLYDMHGNLWEWCSDFYGDYPTGTVVNPIGAVSGTGRVRRGGSWFSSVADCRSAKRNTSMPDYHGNILGFRLVRTVK